MSINYLILKSVPCFLLSKHILIQKMIAAIASSYWNESSEKKLETPEHAPWKQLQGSPVRVQPALCAVESYCLPVTVDVPWTLHEVQITYAAIQTETLSISEMLVYSKPYILSH